VEWHHYLPILLTPTDTEANRRDGVTFILWLALPDALFSRYSWPPALMKGDGRAWWWLAAKVCGCRAATEKLQWRPI